MEKEENGLKTIKWVIAIAAGKGGVGKSTVTANLAFALQKMHYQVGILDADVYGPSIKKMVGEEIAAREEEPSNPQLIPAVSKGIRYISLASFAKDERSIAVRAPIANALIEKFLYGVEWGWLDFLLIDLPPGTGDIPLTLGQRGVLSGVLFVTTPQEVALLDVEKTLGLFQKLNVPLIGIIENMSYFFNPVSQENHFLFGKGGGEKLATKWGLPFLGDIPIDACISQCGDEGQSLFDLKEKHLLIRHWEVIKNLFLEHLFALEKKENAPSIHKIVQKDSNCFIIEWTDGRQSQYCPGELQAHCPCARCREGKIKSGGHSLSDDAVQALEIECVGKYAIRIYFSSGCSKGIYSHSLLRNLAL